MTREATSNAERFRGSPLAQRIGAVVLAATILLHLTVITYSMADRLDSVKRVSVFVFLWFIGLVALVLLSRAWPKKGSSSVGSRPT
jgi:protein-S-isoprenylcysteine O-methyltransferase Ste14